VRPLSLSLKKNGEQLMLEIPGEGQANMIADGGERFHFKEIPVVLQFNMDARGKASGFLLTQNRSEQIGEWIKLPGEDQSAITGQYRLKNNPYKSIYVRETAGKLTSEGNEGPALPLVDSAGKLRVKAGDYTVWYEFIKDKEGRFIKVITREGGIMGFMRVKDYDVSFDGGFSRPNGFTHADTLRGMLTPLRICYDVNFYALDVEVFPYKSLSKVTIPYVSKQSNLLTVCRSICLAI
jgi:hypothetical protein